MYSIGEEYTTGITYITEHRGVEYEIHFYGIPGPSGKEVIEEDLEIYRIVDLSTMAHVDIRFPLGRTILRSSMSKRMGGNKFLIQPARKS